MERAVIIKECIESVSIAKDSSNPNASCGRSYFLDVFLEKKERKEKEKADYSKIWFHQFPSASQLTEAPGIISPIKSHIL